MRKISLAVTMVLVLLLASAACSKGNNDDSSSNTAPSSSSVTATPEPAAAPSSAESSKSGEPACGEELLKKIPEIVPFPEDAYFFSVCEDSNEYGSGIAVSYQTSGEAAVLAKTYRDALEGEYEYSGMDVLDITSMQFTKGEEAIVIEIDASSGDSKLNVNLSHGIYPGGFDNAVEGVLTDIVDSGDEGT